MIDDTPTHCQFPDCDEPPRYIVTWFALAGTVEKRAAVCRQHRNYVSNLAPVRSTVEIGEKEG